MDSIHPGQQSPPTLRTLQPAVLHSFHHTQEDQTLGAAQNFAAAAGAFGLHPADQNTLLQQGFLGQVSDPRSIRQPGAFFNQHGRPLESISNLHQQSFLPTALNVGQFSYGATQSQHFILDSFVKPQGFDQVPIQEPEAAAGKDADGDAAQDDGHASFVPDPPGLAAWRNRLFHLDETVVMTEDQYKTYWPHVDNIYSHRSTQRYKRKPFVSHYMDCRLKGRPSGTPKSDDPLKKKRKRVARERDLCDVKIRVTEYEPGAATPEAVGQLTEQVVNTSSSTQAGLDSLDLGTGGLGQQNQQWPFAPMMNPSPYHGKIFTIQRVNGNGANGKVDGHPGPHRHTLQDSDRIKKSSVTRWMREQEKAKKRSQETQAKQDDKKGYHTKATGKALETVKRHSTDNDLKLFGSCFCPFVQRVWISLEHKKIPYQYIEVDPYKKPQSLLEVNPRGLVPALRHGDWGCYESTVLMEYLEDLNVGKALMPPDAKARAHSRLWSDHVNRHIIPVFYRFLQEQDTEKQIEHASELKNQISKLVNAADPVGPFFLGREISYVDIQVAPWIVRLNRVLKPYRSWPDPEPGSRWGKLVDAIEKNESVQATLSTDELYLDSYQRYAENRPNTSQLANAVNSGRGLP
ncbi:glutathione S-transferase [Phyllosticta citricarpa]